MAAPCDNLSISGLTAGMDEETVKGIFGPYGDITSVKVVGQTAYIKFATVDEATWIQENLNGNMPEGLTEPIEVKFSPDKGKGKDAGKGWGGKGDWSSGWGKAGKGDKGEKGESWGPYAKGGKDWGGKDAGGKDAGGKDKGKGEGKDGKDGKGKGKGKGKVGIKVLFDGLCEAGALPGGAKYENDENTLFVGGLPSDTTDLDLYKIFSPFGSLAPKGILAMIYRDTGACKGFGFVNFMDSAAAQAATAALNGTTMGDEGAELTVTSKRLPGSEEGKGEGKAKGEGKGDKGWGKGWGKGKGKW